MNALNFRGAFRRHHFLPALVMLVSLLPGTSGALAGGARSQQGGAAAQEARSRSVEAAADEGPVEIVGLTVEGRQANVFDDIIAGKGWLKSLGLKFKNTHTQSIVYMEVELEIKKVGNMRYPLRLPLRFGERRAGAAGQASGSPGRIAPNEKRELTLSDSTYDFLLQFMQENQVDEVDGVKVFVELIVFDDDTAWGKGHVLGRDPDDPKRWVVKGVWQRGRASFYQPESARPYRTATGG